MMQRTLIETADGSHSLYVNELDEHYHSIHGAIAEAIHVFIKAGVQHLYEKGMREVNILEIGFGTGLNTLLTLLEAERLNMKINYTSLEAFPLDMELLNQLNYVEMIATAKDDLPNQVRDDNNYNGHADLVSASVKNKLQNKIEDDFQKIHSAKWEQEISLSDNFTLHKIKNTLQNITFKKQFDLIYFDAFGPRVQPEMWTEELFMKIWNATSLAGCLVTYCAKGEVKRTLKKVGYVVETLPGPPRKREMVRGNKNVSA